jgi:tetratricopeptide (TPR) repeat protein
MEVTLRCPACGVSAEPGAWFCEQCAERLPTSQAAPSGRGEGTDAAALDPFIDDPTDAEPPEAQAFVQRTDADVVDDPLTASEALLLDLLEGPQAVQEIERQGVLSRSELELALVSLSTRGLVDLSSEPPPSPSPSPSPRLTPPANAKVERRLVQAPKAPSQDRERATIESLADGTLKMTLRSKAEALGRAASRDKATGSVISARMNLKLAIALDPGNPAWVEALEDLSAPPGQQRGRNPDDPAWRRFDEAVAAEGRGDIDQALRLLRAALQLQEHAAFYNRLGVLLATKQHQLVLGERMLRRALELEPGSHVYVQNLAQILAARAVNREAAPAPREV